MHTEVVVIGGGQAGLSAAYRLGRAGLEDFVVLDDGPEPGGAWRHRWESLTLGRVHDVHDLPGLAMRDADPRERASLAMGAYFAVYEREFGILVHRPVRVRAVREATPDEADGASGLLAVETDSGMWVTRGVINATGTWQRPFWPACPGRSTFVGRQLHARDYRSAQEFAGRHVVVVGGGMFAVSLLMEISAVTSTTWVTRRRPVFGMPAMDEESRSVAFARMDERTSAGLPPLSVVSVSGLPLTAECRRGLNAGLLDSLPMFARIVPDGVMWAAKDVPPASTYMSVDVIVWATGFRAGLDHLAPLKLRSRNGGVVMDGPQVVADPRVQLLGYGSSASIVGAGRASRVAVRNMRRLLGF